MLTSATAFVGTLPSPTSPLRHEPEEFVRTSSSSNNYSRTRRFSKPRPYALSSDIEALERECFVYASFIDEALSESDYLKEYGYLPLTVAMKSSLVDGDIHHESMVVKVLLNKLSDGTIMAFLANKLHPGSLSLDKFIYCSPEKGPQTEISNFRKQFAIMTNLNNFISRIANKPFNITACSGRIAGKDIVEGDPKKVFELLWCIIRLHFTQNISLNARPELFQLADGVNITVTDLALMSPEDLLLRWVNFHLERAGSIRMLKNFSSDISDSGALVILMSQIKPELCNTQILRSVLEIDLPSQITNSNSDIVDKSIDLEVKLKRATFMLQNADLLGCKYFVTPQDVATGNFRLNFAFIATLFMKHPGLSQLCDQLEYSNMREENENLGKRVVYLENALDILKRKAIAEVENLKIESNKIQESIKLEASLNELALSDKIECLKLKLHDKKKPNNEILIDNILVDQLKKCKRLLSAYRVNRDMILENANEYTVSAFDNEGKKISFKIPAPSLTTRCSMADIEKIVATAELNEKSINSDEKISLPKRRSSLHHDKIVDSPLKREITLSETVISDSDLITQDSQKSAELSTPAKAQFSEKSVQPAEISEQKHFLKGLPVEIYDMVYGLVSENMTQLQQIQLLAAKVEEMTWLNQVMGKKIKEFSEELINPKLKKK